MKLSSMIVLAVALAPAAAAGAEYHIYRDSDGRIVLSNLHAAAGPADRSPESLAIVKTYDWPEATAEEIAATENENRQAAQTSALRDLAAQAERLADEIQRSNDIVVAALQQQTLRPPVEINQIAVTTDGFGKFRFKTRDRLIPRSRMLRPGIKSFPRLSPLAGHGFRSPGARR